MQYIVLPCTRLIQAMLLFLWSAWCLFRWPSLNLKVKNAYEFCVILGWSWSSRTEGPPIIFWKSYVYTERQTKKAVEKKNTYINTQHIWIKHRTKQNKTASGVLLYPTNCFSFEFALCDLFLISCYLYFHLINKRMYMYSCLYIYSCMHIRIFQFFSPHLSLCEFDFSL